MIAASQQNWKRNKESQARRGHSFGSSFLEGLSLNEDDTVRYSLTVRRGIYFLVQRFGGVIRLYYQMNSYVIRDIPAFLKQ